MVFIIGIIAAPMVIGTAIASTCINMLLPFSVLPPNGGVIPLKILCLWNKNSPTTAIKPAIAPAVAPKEAPAAAYSRPLLPYTQSQSSATRKKLFTLDIAWFHVVQPLENPKDA